MARVSDVLAAIDRIAPFSMAFEEDRVGLQVGSLESVVAEAVVSLDCSLDAIAYAESVEAQVLVSHHPVIWEPLRALDTSSYAARRALALAKAGIAHIAAHTNWDAAPDGLNDHLAKLLGISNVRPFGRSAQRRPVKLVTFVPEDSVEGVIDALARCGAGEIGLYRRCAFTSRGKGTFVPLPGSNPSVGRLGTEETVDEVRVEMLVAGPSVEAAVQALREAHPYEEPAYDLLQLADLSIQPIGRLGELPKPLRLSELARSATEALETTCRVWGDPAKAMQTLAVVGGAGDDHWQMAQAAGADALLTGEVRHHVALEASDSGFALIEAGHYGTENPGCARLVERLRTELPEVAWRLYAPKPGSSGRPSEQ